MALSAEFTPPSRYVSLEAIDAIVAPSNNSEAYTLEVSALSEVVTLLGNSPAAVFYAAQSFLSLAALDAAIESCQVLDYPRFSYRCVEMCTAVSSSLTILALRNKSFTLRTVVVEVCTWTWGGTSGHRRAFSRPWT